MKSLRALIDRLKWLGPLFARIVLGVVFIDSGWQKLHNLTGITEYFQSLGIPLAQVQAPIVAGLEFSCGLLVLLGLATRFAALPLRGIMAVAIGTAKLGDLEAWTDLFALSEFLYITLCVWLLTSGPGNVSLDQKILPSLA